MTYYKTLTMRPELLIPLAAKMSEEPFRLIIMDSITANLRVDFTGRGAQYTSAVLTSRKQVWHRLFLAKPSGMAAGVRGILLYHPR